MTQGARQSRDQRGDIQANPQADIRAREIFNKTKRFVWYKFAIDMISMFISIGIAAAAFFIANSVAPLSDFEWYTDAQGYTQIAAGSIGPWIGALIAWLILSGIISTIINIFWRFRIRAAHVAVVTATTLDQKLPEGSIIKFGNDIVKNRLGAMGVLGFWVVCRLVRSAAYQIGNVMTRGANFLLGRAGTVGQVASQGIGKTAKIVVKSTSEVSMAWVFYRTDLRPIRAITNGVGLYFQNWRTMLSAAFGTAIIKMIIYFVFGLLAFGLLAVAILTMNLWFIIGSVAFLMLAQAIKNAFLDSYRMCRMVSDFMKVAPSARVDGQNMNMMRGCMKYRILENRAEADERKHGANTGNPPPVAPNAPASPKPKAAPKNSPKFCPETGKPL